MMNGRPTGVTAAFDSQIAAAASIRLLGGPSLNLNGRSAAATDITMVGATLDTGGGVLTQSGSIFVNDSGTNHHYVGDDHVDVDHHHSARQQQRAPGNDDEQPQSAGELSHLGACA